MILNRRHKVAVGFENLFEVDQTLIVISRFFISHKIHKSCSPRRNSKTFVQSQFIFALVFWVVDDTWNWVQRVRCLWFWFSVGILCNRTVFFVFVHIITVSVVSCKTEDTTCLFDCCFKTFFMTIIVIMLYFKCRLGDIKPYTIGRCRDLKPATMPTLILKSAYFFMHNHTPTFKQNVLSAICNGAQIYKDIFIDFEYQVFSKSYTKNSFYIISATKSNFFT